MGTKLGQTIHDHKISLEFDHGCNWIRTTAVFCLELEQEGHDGPVSLHWLICEIASYQILQYLGIGLKQKTPQQGLKLVATVLMFCNKKISKDFTI